MIAYKEMKKKEEWMFWELPSDISWWKAQSRDTVDALCKYDIDQDDFGRNNCAATIIAAIEEVRAWIKQGVVVKDRNWIDIGGFFGYHSIALKLLGAKTVTLVDETAPGKFSRPILDAVGVNVITEDAYSIDVPFVDSILCLFVPGVYVGDFLSSATTQVITDQTEIDQEPMSQWKQSKIHAAGAYFSVSAGYCCPDYENRMRTRDREETTNISLFKSTCV